MKFYLKDLSPKELLKLSHVNRQLREETVVSSWPGNSLEKQKDED
jgi:hypothetical protein